jgi:hypothetical protein
LHREYCRYFNNAGLETEYFGLQEQLELVNKITADNSKLTNIISDAGDTANTGNFSHKGASIMRNITYLKIQQDLSQSAERDNTLVYFIDSDQEFCINSPDSDENYYAVNYFHYLNEIFKTQDVSILTGKVVGDPPVSPSVMAGNFQQDIHAFLNTLAGLKPDDACCFHQHNDASEDDAAYHDMANLFGFNRQEQVFSYHCTLQSEHTNADCFRDFSEKLGHFFYGEHPTRKTFFNYGNGFSKTTPARTVYTGNYVIKPDALKYFIPFATLKLRMAGPVLGRILKAELKDGFVSANLPMLHNRTVESTGQSEFRPGVQSSSRQIDLGDEFIRQFYGDVMLFTIEEIIHAGFPEKSINSETLQRVLDKTCVRIRQNYIEKHNAILKLRARISDFLKQEQSWWNDKTAGSETKSALCNFATFLENIRTNFEDDSTAYQQITSSEYTQKYLAVIFDAIQNYNTDRNHWNSVLTP